MRWNAYYTPSVLRKLRTPCKSAQFPHSRYRLQLNCRKQKDLLYSKACPLSILPHHLHHPESPKVCHIPCCCSVTKSSLSVMSDSLQPRELQHTRLPCPSPTLGVCSNSCPWSRWCHPIISSSVVPFSSCPQSFPASGSFPMSQFFASVGHCITAFKFLYGPALTSIHEHCKNHSFDYTDLCWQSNVSA